MNVLLVGVSHRSASTTILEKVVVLNDERPQLLAQLLNTPQISEAMVVSTCNRMEIYAVVDAFHPALADIAEILREHSGLEQSHLADSVYVRYGSAAVEHLFTVAAGLDSMVVGEQQILGQIRVSYREADAHGTIGHVLHEVAQEALRVGKRVHSETGIDAAGASTVSVALDRTAVLLNSFSTDSSSTDSSSTKRATPGLDAERSFPDLCGHRAVVLGAGSMGSLAVASLGRSGIAHIDIANRTRSRAQRLVASASEAHWNASEIPMSNLIDAIATCDVFISCIGSDGKVFTKENAQYVMAQRASKPLVICDLGIPHSVEKAVAEVPNVFLLDMTSLREDPKNSTAINNTSAARQMITAELNALIARQSSAKVVPTVTALRKRAREVADVELARLDARLPNLEIHERNEVARAVHRVLDKLLHAPTVRVKELASTPDGATYAKALGELFDLDPAVLGLITQSSVDGESAAMEPPTALSTSFAGSRSLLFDTKRLDSKLCDSKAVPANQSDGGLTQ